MRILCLHGSGASATIMEAQSGPLRDLLPTTWDFDFLDAPHDSGPAPELKGIYPGPYHCFFEKYSAEAMAEAIEYVRDVVENDGPYDVVMGFSQGASVAAAFIADNKRRTAASLSSNVLSPASSVASPPSAFSTNSGSSYFSNSSNSSSLVSSSDDAPFKLAIFMCAGLIPPAIATGPELVRTIGSFGDIDIPTVHVVGQKDPVAPQSLQLVKTCRPDALQIVFHSGGHDMPRDAAGCRNIAAGIERGLNQALSG